MVEPDEKCISVVHYFSGGAPLNIQRDRYYWKKKKEATHFLPKMEVNYGSSFGGGTGSKTDLGMPAGKKPLWKSTISFWFTVGFSHTQVEAAQAFLPLLKQALEVRCHMWEIIHRLWRDISHASSSKSRFFFRFWEELFATHIDLHHGCNLLTLCSIVLKCRIAIASLKDFLLLLDWETWYLGLSTPLY